MAKAMELRKKSVADLRVELAKTQRELAEVKRSHAARELANPVKLTNLRKDIARLHTLIAEINVTADKEIK